MTVLRDLSRYGLDLVGVQEVRWEDSGTEPEHTLFHGRGNENMNLVQIFSLSLFLHKQIISAVERVEFVSGWMPHIILRGCWFRTIVLNIHAPTENKIDDAKDSFYEKLECIFDKCPK
jgi:hypothetical protein